MKQAETHTEALNRRRRPTAAQGVADGILRLMSPARLKFLSFFLGLLLAVALGLATRPSSTALARTNSLNRPTTSHSEIVNAISNSAIQLGVDSKRSKTSQDAARSIEDSLPIQNSSAAPNHSLSQLEQLDPQKRMSLLVQALREGSLSSLQELQDRQISLLPGYRETVLPRLRAEGLDALLGRFRQVDWLSWSLSSFAVDGGPTEARLFVDRVSAVNNELGSFLETAAEMFHGVFLATKQGREFSPQDYLDSLLQSSERSESDPKRAPAALPRESIDALILHDTTFVERFEALRSQLVISYVQSHPSDTLTSFSLLLSTPPSVRSDVVVEALLMLLRRFTLEASPKFRAQVFDIVQRSLTLRLLVKREPAMRRSLAELYLMGSMDALESDDRRRAAVYLDESQSYTTGLKGQEILSEYLKSVAQTPKSAAPSESQSTQAEPAKEASAKGDETSEKERPSLLSRFMDDKPAADEQSVVRTTLVSGISYLSMLLFVLLIGGGVFIFIIYRRSLDSLSGVNLPRRSSTENGGSMKMTAPNEMDFGEEFELGSKSNQSPF
ncbi:MAG: hypothetical protein U0136_02540 [Bdellovibrionota bacterium]